MSSVLAPQSDPSGRSQSAPRLRLLPQLGRRVSGRAVIQAVVVLTVTFVIQLWLSNLVIQDAYLADSLEGQQLELEREHKATLEAADSAASPQNLAAQATALGMVPSNGTSYLDLATDTVLANPNAGAEKPIDPSLVPNALLTPKTDDSKAENSGTAGASEQSAAKPAVPSEFQMVSPTTH